MSGFYDRGAHRDRQSFTGIGRDDRRAKTSTEQGADVPGWAKVKQPSASV